MTLHVPYPEEGTYVIGGTGTRKSTLLLHRMLLEIEAGNAFTLIDPHAELARDVATHVDPAKRIMLDLIQGFGLNLFACRDPHDDEAVGRTLDQVMQAFSKLWGAAMNDTPRLARYLRNSALPMILTGGTMADLLTFLRDQPTRNAVLTHLPSSFAYVTDFWREHDALDKREREQRVESTMSRVAAFVEDPITGRIFSRRDQAVDWRRAMDEGTSVLVLLDPQLETVTNFVGAVILGQILNAVLSRSDTTHRPSYGLFVDEYDRLATPATASLFTQGRKYKLRPLIAHQHRGNLGEEMRRATLQVANVIVLRVAPPDNEELSGIFDTTPPEPEERGTEPVRTPTPRPFYALTERGHSDFVVAQIAAHELQPLQQLVSMQSPELHSSYRMVDGDSLMIAEISSLNAGIVQLNQLFFDAMTDKLGSSVYLGTRLAKIAYALRAYLKLYPERSMPVTPEEAGLSAWKVFLSQRTDREEEAMNTPLARYAPDSFERWLDHVCSAAALTWDLGGTYQDVVTAVVGAVPSTGEWWDHERGRIRLMTWSYSMLVVTKTLREQPILVDSGQYLPVKERPRSRDDVRSQIANELATLPSGTARTRIRTATGFRFEEYIVPPPPSPGLWPVSGTSNSPQTRSPETPTLPSQMIEPAHEDFNAAPAYRWETIPARKTSPSSPLAQQAGWHWEAAPSTKLRDQVRKPRAEPEEVFYEEEPPASPKRKRDGPPPPMES